MAARSYSPEPGGLLGDPIMQYVRSSHIRGPDANLFLSSQDSSMDSTSSIISSWSDVSRSQDTTLATNDELSGLDTTLSQYIASLFPTSEGSFFTSSPFLQPDHVLQNGSLPVALAFTSDQPQFATPMLISCTGSDHVTVEPMHPTEATLMTGISTTVPPSNSSVERDMLDVLSTPEGLPAAATASQEEDLPDGKDMYEQTQDQAIPTIGITTTSPQSSSSLSTSSASSSSSASSTEPVSPPSTHPTFTCRVDNCATDLHVDYSTLEAHLGAVHGYPPVRHGHALECRWFDCVCKLKCKDREPQPAIHGVRGVHGIHKEDITKHIWEAHLDFQTPCPKCGEVGWVPGFSMNRHKKTCAGRKPARCQMCYELFPSEVVLGAHYELRLCPRRTPDAALMI
jgi:hypothetical protein